MIEENYLKKNPYTWVFMRGLVRESRHWGKFIDKFANMLIRAGVENPQDNFRFIELPGIGKKHQDRLSFNVRNEINKLNHELMETNASPPYAFVGVSLGALVGLQWEAFFPETFHRMVLINTSHVRINPVFHRLRLNHLVKKLPVLVSGDIRRSEEAILDLVCNNAELKKEILEEWVDIREKAPWGFRNLLEQLIFAIRAKWLPKRNSEKFLFLGSLNDRLVNVNCTIDLMKSLNAPGAFHPSAGHDLSLDEPDWLCAEILAWLLKSNFSRHP